MTLTELSPHLVILLPLALAAGVDLYLTLFMLCAAAITGWWTTPLAGSLGDLNSTAILAVVGLFYLLEFAAERTPGRALFWNGFHALIRPVAGALIALLVLDHDPVGVQIVGAVLTGAATSLAHAVRSGRMVLRWLLEIATPRRDLMALLEDVSTVGLLTLALDLPLWSLGASISITLIALVRARERIKAFAFGVRLGHARIWQQFTRSRWMDPEELPGWVLHTLEPDAPFTGGGLRGAPAAAWRLPGVPRLVIGWVVVRGDTTVFVFRAGRKIRMLELGSLQEVGAQQMDFYRQVTLEVPGQDGRAEFFFGLGGPGVESLRAVFLGHGAKVSGTTSAPL
ncbi:MAG: DUF4126 domain-containing protein [Gemmatimonadota bacterium]|nr:DUF4126 domain-containing protein [Gemmatimonadota bacterium]